MLYFSAYHHSKNDHCVKIYSEKFPDWEYLQYLQIVR